MKSDFKMLNISLEYPVLRISNIVDSDVNINVKKNWRFFARISKAVKSQWSGFGRLNTAKNKWIEILTL